MHRSKKYGPQWRAEQPRPYTRSLLRRHADARTVLGDVHTCACAGALTRSARALFISVLADHFVHIQRLRLKARGIDGRWERLRRATFTRPDALHHKIDTILGLSTNPGGAYRVVVSSCFTVQLGTTRRHTNAVP